MNLNNFGMSCISGSSIKAKKIEMLKKTIGNGYKEIIFNVPENFDFDKTICIISNVNLITNSVTYGKDVMIGIEKKINKTIKASREGITGAVYIEVLFIELGGIKEIKNYKISSVNYYVDFFVEDGNTEIPLYISSLKSETAYKNMTTIGIRTTGESLNNVRIIGSDNIASYNNTFYLQKVLFD